MRMNNERWFIAVVSGTILLLILYMSNTWMVHHNPVAKGNQNVTFLLKRILQYHGCGVWFDLIGEDWESKELFRGCQIPHCVLSRDKLMMNNSDAVIFQFEARNITIDIPEMKPHKQIWIMSQLEPSTGGYYSADVQKKFNNLINWTMGFRRDSDIYMPYGGFRTFERNHKSEEDIRINKSKMAVGLISDCGSNSGRMEYIKKLRKHIDVVIYGYCENKTCDYTGPGNTHNLDSFRPPKKISNGTKGCFSILDTTYKFFLALENSLCRDYITEKSFHMVMTHTIVPIARTGGNHSIMHPPNSVINTQDFKNITALGEYLVSVNKNESEYLKYFKWRSDYYVVGFFDHWKLALCDICRRLHTKDQENRLYSNIYKHLVTPNEKRACHDPTDFK